MEEISNKLYVVSTPIGNLDELSPRALFILNNVDFIACEDTRNTLKLCSHFKIEKTLISCHEHNEYIESDRLINLIKEGKSIAIVSDAGFPGISDPGSLLIDKCIDNEIKVEIISGPCALINALVGSGLDTTHFYFHGFLDHKRSDKKKELELIKDKTETMIFYESPHRVEETLEDMLLVLGNRKACIAKELTKIHEEFIRMPLNNLLELTHSNPFKGELVIVVEGNSNKEVAVISEIQLINEVDKLVSQGYSTKDAIKSVADLFNISKNTLYNLYHQ